MKKIFILALSLPLLVCGRFYYDPGRFANDMQGIGDRIAVQLHTLSERNHENYWLNNLRTYKTYPIDYFGGHMNASEGLTQIQTHKTHDYPRNVPVSADVGQRLVALETFNVQYSNLGSHYEVNSDGEISNSAFTIKLTKGQVVTPIGEVNINGRYFALIEPERDGHFLLFDETGQIMHNIGLYHRGELLISEDITSLEPKDLQILRTDNIKQETSSPTMKYEIVYNGLVEDHMEFKYVDYQAGRLTKYFDFPRNQQIVNVNGIMIKVLNVTDKNIEYILLN